MHEVQILQRISGFQDIPRTCRTMANENKQKNVFKVNNSILCPVAGFRNQGEMETRAIHFNHLQTQSNKENAV